MKYISYAIEASYFSEMAMKHGCVIVENNCIIGRGWNSYRTRFKDNFIGISCSCHAEMNAFRQIKKRGRRSRCNVYVIRRSSGGYLNNSKPCYDCYQRMKDYGVKYIIYSSTNGIMIKRRIRDFRPPQHKTLGRRYIEHGYSHPN